MALAQASRTRSPANPNETPNPAQARKPSPKAAGERRALALSSAYRASLARHLNEATKKARQYAPETE